VDLLSRKLEHGFRHLDADGDGVLTEHDHVLMGESVATSLGYSEGSLQQQRIIDAYLTIWRDLHLPFVPPGAAGISKEQFATSTRTLSSDPALAQATVGALAEAFLDIADDDGDGALNGDEFYHFQHGHFPNLSREDAAAAFATLDADGDGLVSGEEFVAAIVEYWTSSDPAARGNHMTGPLPDFD
jgi:Ca2+-binding EF-hand superfamily protein